MTVARRKVIAVIDDDPLMLQALTRLLKARSFEVRAFSTAHAFLDGDAANEVDCLVLDIGLIGVSGIELAQRLNAADRRFPLFS
jgi:FixJ family two-component response regulator